MEATASTPVTDSEQWSDGTEIRSGDEMGDPQRDGYQVLGEGENDDDDEDHPDAGILSIGRLAEENPDFAEGGFGQEDVASLLLRAMDAEYQACIESERPTSNGPVGSAVPAAPDTADDNTGSETASGHDDQDEQKGRRDPAEGLGQEEGVVRESMREAAVVRPPPPRRPISPLGRDQADRVMRAMQGFALSAPSPPPPRFEADWEGASAMASLASSGGVEESKGVFSR